MKEEGNIYLGEPSTLTLHCSQTKLEGVSCILSEHVLPGNHTPLQGSEGKESERHKEET